MAQNEHCDKPRKIKSFENNNLQTRENKNNSIPGGGRKSLAALGRSNAVNKSPIVPAISLSTTNSLEQEENSGMYDNFFKKSKTHVPFSIPKMKIFEPFCYLLRHFIKPNPLISILCLIIHIRIYVSKYIHMGRIIYN